MLLISVDEARQITLDAVRPLGTEDVDLGASVGRILAVDIVSREDVPPFDNSAMDGYAIRSADVSGGSTTLQVVGEIPCGVTPGRVLESGECMRIMTGAQIPHGCDAVIQQELVRRSADELTIDAPVRAGANIRMSGSNIRNGDTVVPGGTTITPGTIGMLATLGYSRVTVSKRPRVAVFSSGDELVAVNEVPGPSQIRNSNGPALAAQVRASGGAVASERVLRDNVDSIRSEIRTALESKSVDVIVVSGGASVGDYDLVRQELESMGMRVPFWKIRQRPGKPMAFGLLDAIPIFMLPGNPVSASICFQQYVRPFLLRMSGSSTPAPHLVAARFRGSLEKHAKLHYFARGHAFVDDTATVVVQVAGKQGSHVSQSLLEANCLIHLPEKTESPEDGSLVFIEWLDW